MHLTVDNDEGLLGPRQSQVDVVRGHRHRRSVIAQPIQGLQHLGDSNRVKSSGGLIKEQQIRAHGHGTGNRDPLALTVGQLVRGTLSQVTGPKQF
jgi:hypothetical protein